MKPLEYDCECNDMVCKDCPDTNMRFMYIKDDFPMFEMIKGDISKCIKKLILHIALTPEDYEQS